jgi:predicted class III extradiol MEMO1 family dioxygenase
LFLRREIIVIFLVLSCSGNEPQPQAANEVPLYHTWHSLKEREYGEPLHPPSGENPPPGFFPWAGIVSHHLLTHNYIDSWFSRLAELRQVKRFYILCPSHFGLSTEPYSLTAGSWESGFGLVE